MKYNYFQLSNKEISVQEDFDSIDWTNKYWMEGKYFEFIYLSIKCVYKETIWHLLFILCIIIPRKKKKRFQF